MPGGHLVIHSLITSGRVLEEVREARTKARKFSQHLLSFRITEGDLQAKGKRHHPSALQAHAPPLQPRQAELS